MAENVKVAKSLGENDCEKRRFTLYKIKKILPNKEIKFKKADLNEFTELVGKWDRKQVEVEGKFRVLPSL